MKSILGDWVGLETFLAIDRAVVDEMEGIGKG